MSFNIFSSHSGNESTDSGHHSGPAKCKIDSNSSSPVDDRVAYKIGDLGHVAPIYGDAIPEEGDCRYMAPELLAMHIDRDLLIKADVFSLGLTLFEAASLMELPKNSLEDLEYENLKAGQLPYLDGYSKDFNSLLKAMVNPDPRARPSGARRAAAPPPGRAPTATGSPSRAEGPTPPITTTTTQKVPPATVSCRPPPQSELSSVSPLIRCSNMGKNSTGERDSRCFPQTIFLCRELGTWPPFFSV